MVFLSGKYIHEASFRREYSMNCLISDTSLGMMSDSKRNVSGYSNWCKLAFSVAVEIV